MRIPFLKRESIPDSDSLLPAIERFWESLKETGFNPRLIHRVWVANRCIQLNSQQIASMPLRFLGNSQPAWVTNPDPIWYPNGIGDAIFSAVWSMYGWGDAFLYVTSRYASGLPSAWTVLDPAAVTVEAKNGSRVYRSSGRLLQRDDVVQISRNPHGGLRGTSALRAYAPYLWGSIATGELAASMQGGGGVPFAVLKSEKKLNPDQAAAIQSKWAEAALARRGMPAVLGPDLDIHELSFSPKDLLLLEAQEFTARVIASAFSVPAFMLNITHDSGFTYSNTQMLFDFWWRAELRPAAERISDALTSQMLPRGSSVRFDARDVLAPSLPELHKIWMEALQQAAVTVDEYRRAVLQLGSLGDQGAIDELLQPSSAGASPADQPAGEIVTLRPNQLQSGVSI